MSSEQDQQQQQQQEGNDATAAAAPTAARPHAIVLFFGGLTARMGFASQKSIARLADIAINVVAVLCFVIGYYTQSFRYVLYGIAVAGTILFIALVPNWGAAVRSAKAGRIVNGDEGMQFLPNSAVRQYYETVRKDELRVEPHRKGPHRF